MQLFLECERRILANVASSELLTYRLLQPRMLSFLPVARVVRVVTIILRFSGPECNEDEEGCHRLAFEDHVLLEPLNATSEKHGPLVLSRPRNVTNKS